MYKPKSREGVSHEMIGWETGRMDEWMMGGWKGGRERREREEAG